MNSLSDLRPLSQLHSDIQGQISNDHDETRFDVIVLGVGSMGSSACYYLAKHGHKVLGLEQFSISHEYGSHTGQSRIIRKAYFEHPSYVPLLESSYENWKTIEAESSSQLYFKTGLAYFGPPDNLLIEGSLQSASQYQINLKKLSSKEQQESLPQFEIPDGYSSMIEPDAGFLSPERAILTFVDQALKNGASIHTGEKVNSWHKKDGVIYLKTDRQTYQCKKLVITTGAWSTEHVGIKELEVTRQIIAWAKPKNLEIFSLDNFPCWTYADPSAGGIFYGFPFLPEAIFGGVTGLKFAHHFKGQLTDPNNVNRKVSQEEEEWLVDAISKFLPNAIESILTMHTCLYTYTPDDNFIIDFHPEDEDVVVEAGFSGHGFKFSSVVGEILYDLVTKGSTSHPIDFLDAKRF